MRGFTTVRDLGGPSFALKQAIDDGLATGPRIYPSGAMIRRPAAMETCVPVRSAKESRRPADYLERTGAANIRRQCR